MKRRLSQGVYLMAFLSQLVVRPISKFYDTAMNMQRVAGRGIRAGLLSSAALVLALAACSSRASRDVGPLSLQPPIGDPLIKVIADETTPGISFLSWDTEGGEKVATNLLRAGSAVRVQFLADGSWADAKMIGRRPGSGGDVFIYGLEAGKSRLEWRIEAIHELGIVATDQSAADRKTRTPPEALGSLHLTLFAGDAKPTAPGSIRLIFPFDPKATSPTAFVSYRRCYCVRNHSGRSSIGRSDMINKSRGSSQVLPRFWT